MNFTSTNRQIVRSARRRRISHASKVAPGPAAGFRVSFAPVPAVASPSTGAMTSARAKAITCALRHAGRSLSARVASYAAGGQIHALISATRVCVQNAKCAGSTFPGLVTAFTVPHAHYGHENRSVVFPLWVGTSLQLEPASPVTTPLPLRLRVVRSVTA